MYSYKSKRNIFILLSPLIVIAVMCISYALYGIFPFGTKTAAWCDLNQQTIPFMMNLKDILDGKSSIFYTFHSGGGMNFWGVFLFFLASPLYLAVKFISKQDMSYFATVLLVVKLAACSLTACFYFSQTFKKLEKRYAVFFSLIYAFCGYGLMYYQTLVWLDIMCLFPLLVLSVDRLCLKNKNLLYIITLSVMTSVNYYLSFMVVIYLIISVPLYIFIRCPEQIRKAVSLKFILSSLAAALITAPVWLCSYFQVNKSARSSSNLAALLFDTPFESIKDKLCIIIAEAFIFAALIFLTKSPLLKKKRVRYNLIVLVFLIIPVFIDPINKMFHFGGYQGFPLRFGYMIIFTLLSIVCDISVYTEKNKGSSVPCNIISFVVMTLVCAAAFWIVLTRKNTLSEYAGYLAVTNDFFSIVSGLFILFFSVYLLFIVLLRKKLISSNIFFILISGVLVTEIFTNTIIYVCYSSSDDSLFKSTVTLENAIDETGLSGLYRVKAERKYFHVNMIGALGMNSYAHYTSLNPENYMFAMKKLGYSSYWMETGSNGGTALTDALLGIKYSVGFDYDFNSYQTAIENKSDFSIALNQLCVPAGIVSDTAPEMSEVLDKTERADIQQQIATRFFGENNIIKKYSYTNIKNGTFEYDDDDGKYCIASDPSAKGICRVNYGIRVEGRQVLYFDLSDTLSNRVSEPVNNSVRVSVNGMTIDTAYPDKIDNGLLEIGEFNDEYAEISISLLKDISAKSFGVFGVDINELNSELNSLETAEVRSDGNEIYADAYAGKNKYLYLAVPWDSGLTAYLNGRKTELYRVNDCFCAVKLNEGENKLKIVFYPDGFKPSIILMTVGIAFAVFLCIRKNPIFHSKKAGSFSLIICRIVFVASSFSIYFTPILIYITGLILY